MHARSFWQGRKHVLICVRNLYLRTTSQTIIKNVSFDLDENNALAIIGPSGCGKTTMLKGILHIADGFITEGQISFTDDEGRIRPYHQIRFGYIPQDLALWPHLNVENTIRLAQRFATNKNKQKTTNGVEQILEDCGLTALKQKKPSTLSGGEKQRLALARALVNEPHLLVLDEPFAHLDLVAKSELMALIKQVRKRLRMSLIFVSHDLAETLNLGDRIMIMDQGAAIWLGGKHELSSTKFLPHWNPLASPLLRLVL